MASTGRMVCRTCEAPVLTVYISGRRTTLDWPQAENGQFAVEHTAGGSWHARYLPVGEATRIVEHRYREHSCGEPVPSITEPLRAAG
jgi:hypothetical protein